MRATKEQTREANKQKLIDTDNSMVATRGKGKWGAGKGSRGSNVWGRKEI